MEGGREGKTDINVGPSASILFIASPDALKATGVCVFVCSCRCVRVYPRRWYKYTFMCSD